MVLYTSDNCRACEAAKRWLAERKVEFVEINIADHDELAEKLAGMGFLSTPVLECDGDYIAGFSPARYARLLAGRGQEDGQV